MDFGEEKLEYIPKLDKKGKIMNYLIEYGFSDKVEEFGNRWENYKEIINTHCKLLFISFDFHSIYMCS